LTTKFSLNDIHYRVIVTTECYEKIVYAPSNCLPFPMTSGELWSRQFRRLSKLQQLDIYGNLAVVSTLHGILTYIRLRAVLLLTNRAMFVASVWSAPVQVFDWKWRMSVVSTWQRQ